jgi:surface antigen
MEMMKLPFRNLILVVVFLSLIGCESTGSMTKEEKGTAIGAVAGGVLGVMLGGSTTGKVIGGVLGVAAGSWIGNKIGQYLDEKDQEKLAESTQKAFDLGESQTWNNPDTGVKADVLVKDVEPASEAKVASTNSTDEPLCREVTQNVTLKDGSTKTETITACKGPNGWEMM